MYRMKNICLAAFTSLLAAQTASAQAPVIAAANPSSNTVEQWDKFEVQLEVSAIWSNPYDYDEIRVVCTFSAPDGQLHVVEGFFMQHYQLNVSNGTLTPVGSGAFRVRFSPNKVGTWQYALSCTNTSGTGTFPTQSFQCVAPTGLHNKGFLRADQSNYLHFDDATPYIAIGENIAWQQNNTVLDYQKWLEKLSDNGGNFFRLWQCHWGLGLEWKNGMAGYQGLRRYHQANAFYTDWLLDFCAQRGIYLLYCLQHHGQVSTQVNPNWNENPYNASNGGPCQQTWDFFTNTLAKNHAKNRYRYVLARWGYSRNILAWELFNEVDWTDQFAQKKADVADWHLEMAAFLKNKDVSRHLISTSFAEEHFDPQVWNQPDIDFTQTHHYVNTPNIERVLSSSVRKYLQAFGKPTLTGEFGLTTTGANLSDADPDGIHVHNALWGALFGGGMGTAMTWWWDSYIEPQNLYYHFAPISVVVPNIPFRDAKLAPAPSKVSGVPADLLLTPTLSGWGVLADTSFSIVDGQIEPAASLATFLYGSQWNTQYRRPPVFYVNYPASGQFRVKTGGQSGQSPKIAIWLDGVKVFEQNASIQQTYTINVSAGAHTIKVDNTGTDWIQIEGYELSGLGSAVDAYIIKSDNDDKVAGWVLNNRYNHAYLKASGTPPPASGALLNVQNVQNGTYHVKYYNCLSGVLHAFEEVTVLNGSLELALPETLWDWVFVVDNQPLRLAESPQHLDFGVYPNPATTGPVTLSLPAADMGSVSVSLLDMAGRTVSNWSMEHLSEGQPQIHLGANLSSGVYWLKMESNGKVGVKALVVQRT